MEDAYKPVNSGITFMGYSQIRKTENPNNKQNVFVSNITKGHEHDGQNRLKYHLCLKVTIGLTAI